eukprot:GGOE01026509.1.p3 GENE.GGOE01026509.1~~GGOE01026509.1.p3  ORF type:complete len:141 (+),score=3.02 GGOE01026509.1:74-496(+)
MAPVGSGVPPVALIHHPAMPLQRASPFPVCTASADSPDLWRSTSPLATITASCAALHLTCPFLPCSSLRRRPSIVGPPPTSSWYIRSHFPPFPVVTHVWPPIFFRNLSAHGTSLAVLSALYLFVCVPLCEVFFMGEAPCP